MYLFQTFNPRNITLIKDRRGGFLGICKQLKSKIRITTLTRLVQYSTTLSRFRSKIRSSLTNTDLRSQIFSSI